MRIFLLGITHPLTQSLAQQLLARNHSIISVVDQSFKQSNNFSAIQQFSNFTMLFDDPSQNGPWLGKVKGQFDVAINATFPSMPVSRLFNVNKESEHLLAITRHLATLSKAEGFKYIQPIPITTFPANGQMPLNSELVSSEYAIGWGNAYITSAKLARQSFPQRQEIIFGQLLYNTEGVIYSTQTPSMTMLTVPINDAESTLTATHEADLIATICYAVENNISQTQLAVMQQEKLTQKEALSLFANKQNKIYLNIPLPISVAKPIYGEIATTWSALYSPPPFTLQQYGQYLQFPTLKAGLHLA